MSDDSSSDVRAVRLPRLASSRLCIMHLSTCWAAGPLIALRISIGSHTPLETGCRSASASTRINEALLISSSSHPPHLSRTSAPRRRTRIITSTSAHHAEIASRCSLSLRPSMIPEHPTIDAHRSEIARGAPAQNHLSAVGTASATSLRCVSRRPASTWSDSSHRRRPANRRGVGEAIAVDNTYALCAVPGRRPTGASSAA
ncbi:hypothetical protein B0H14DRAFT_3484778 [Mycena olivaceomarginata]|nr:hypothetical protein B0H14DRAFT_3484778 [Mycena olivaceomarginata]